MPLSFSLKATTPRRKIRGKYKTRVIAKCTSFVEILGGVLQVRSKSIFCAIYYKIREIGQYMSTRGAVNEKNPKTNNDRK